MTSTDTQTNLMDLMSLIGKVESGRWVLPEFQRDFVWSDNDIRALLATALSDWPMGSLLLMGAGSKAFATRQVDGSLDEVSDQEYIILDGQQRITSLFHALRDKGRKIFAIKWDEEFSKLEDPEEIIFHFTPSVWNRKYGSDAKQAAEKMLPCSALGSASDFFEWRDRILDCYEESSVKRRERERLSNLYSTVISHLHKYRVPAVMLDSDIEPQAISRIFERVNKTGMRLSTFDLMVAKTFLPNWNLRDQWKEAKEQYPNISKYLGDDGLPVLQAISLRADGNLRQSGVLKLEGGTVRESWSAAVAGMDSAIQFMADHLGVYRSEVQPYANMLPVLAAISMNGDLQEKSDTLKKWFWSTVFSGAIDAAANTRLVNHYKALVAATPGAVEIGEVSLNLRVATKYSNKALHRAICCYIAAEEISADLRNFEGDQTILPELSAVGLYSERDLKGAPEFNPNSTINTLLAPTSISKSHGDASLGMKKSAFSSAGVAHIFDSQAQGATAVSPSEFLEKRIQQIVDFLNSQSFGNADFRVAGDESDGG